MHHTQTVSNTNDNWGEQQRNNHNVEFSLHTLLFLILMQLIIQCSFSPLFLGELCGFLYSFLFALVCALLLVHETRGDNQIASLELLSVAFGIFTFAEKLRGRNVVIHSDNTTAENGARKGSARLTIKLGRILSCIVHLLCVQGF